MMNTFRKIYRFVWNEGHTCCEKWDGKTRCGKPNRFPHWHIGECQECWDRMMDNIKKNIAYERKYNLDIFDCNKYD